MSDLDRAKALLTGDKTCVLAKGEAVYTSSENGIRPIMGHLAAGTDLLGFSVADRVVGKAAALLFLRAGISAVWGDVMSESAAALLCARGVPFSCGVLTPRIVNRAGTGVCPMEAAVGDVDDPDAAYAIFREKLKG